MEYAIVLYFNNDTENRIKTIINNIVRKECNRYKLDKHIPPHLTVGSFNSEDEQKMLDVLEKNKAKFKTDNIFFSSFGIFSPSVLYLSPVLNQYLFLVNKNINKLYNKVACIGDYGNYVPYSWAPHVAVATKMNTNEMKVAVQVVQDEFKAFQGTTDRIALVRCDPYKEIKVWSL